MTETVDLTDSEISRAWQQFPRSLIQGVIHNELVTRLNRAAKTLETVSEADLRGAQREAAMYRELIAFIHSKDKTIL